MKILVTGREGQVARSLAERAAAFGDIELVLCGRPELDLTEPDTIRRAIDVARPDLVVSAAAYTAVDQAEDEAELAFAVNAAGAGAVALAAAEAGAPIIHLSTDYVFSGDKTGDYAETDPVGPKGVYGRSKLEGEAAVVAANPRHVILRTAWVYSPFGKNFVKTMLRLGRERDHVSVVSDQWGNPTSALDIADGVLVVARSLEAGSAPEPYGIFHFTGSGATNWSGLARQVFEVSHGAGGPFAEVREIATADYPTKARRPQNSKLENKKFQDTFQWAAPEWRVSAGSVVRRLLGESEGTLLPRSGPVQ